ncbi:hypothetical protein BDZ45DRAFT_708864 [Acephala macrosclerotiorum]|nr:hypothetical protein BDZ45DRAFT_708864 [Acephala macrosclerotiorum]
MAGFNFRRNRNADVSSASTAVPSTANSLDHPRAPIEPVTGDVHRHIHSPEKGDHSMKAVPITLRTIIMAILVAMGGFIFGYDIGQISGFLEMNVFLQRFGQPTTDRVNNPSGYYFTNVRSGLIVGLLSIGTLIGCLIAAPIANRFGRKPCVPIFCSVFIIGVVAQISVGSRDWVGLSVIVPMYMSETAPVPVRGAVVSCYQLFITIGIFTADCINYGTEGFTNTGSYRIPMGVGFIWALILGIGILFLPETPRHDWNHGRSDRATTTMSKFYGLPEHHIMIQTETAEIEKVRAATAESAREPWHAPLTGPRMFYRVALAMALQMLQQLTGANYYFYYGTTIFKGVGLDNSYVTAMILGGVNVGATFFGVWMANHFRRRESLYIAALWQTMCFLIFASVGQFMFKDAPEGSATAKTSGTVMIVFACLFIVGFATTWGPLVWACIGEMFPYRYRAVGMGLATSANWFWNFMLAFFTPFITNDIDYAYGYVFAGCNLAAFFVVFFFLVESSGKTLEEVDAMYLLHVNPIGSAGFRFDEETRNNIGGGGLGTDNMRLDGRGRKLNEAGREGVFQDEGKPVEAGDLRHVTDHTNGTLPVASTGAQR